jgi:hypothetical protein
MPTKQAGILIATPVTYPYAAMSMVANPEYPRNRIPLAADSAADTQPSTAASAIRRAVVETYHAIAARPDIPPSSSTVDAHHGAGPSFGSPNFSAAKLAHMSTPAKLSWLKAFPKSSSSYTRAKQSCLLSASSNAQLSTKKTAVATAI